MEETNNNNYFDALNSVNVSDKVEKKNGLNYLSWAWAWSELKERHPDANYMVYENPDTHYPMFTDGKTAMCKVGVTVNGIEHVEWLPVMDLRNNSKPLESITSFDVNKTIQRCLTKAIARHGLGLYIYAGEDLPEDCDEEAPSVKPAPIPGDEEKASASNVDLIVKLAGRKNYTKDDLESMFKVKLDSLTLKQARELYQKVSALRPQG